MWSDVAKVLLNRLEKVVEDGEVTCGLREEVKELGVEIHRALGEQVDVVLGDDLTMFVLQARALVGRGSYRVTGDLVGAAAKFLNTVVARYDPGEGKKTQQEGGMS